MNRSFCISKLALTAIFAFGLVNVSRAVVSLEVDAGILRNLTGTSVVPVGGLLELVATPSGNAANFAAPTATSFVSGDNIVVASFAMNYSTGVTGETDNVTQPFALTTVNGVASTTTLDAGDPLQLRWYPTLTLASTAPGLGTTYGTFRSDTGELGGAAWVVPTDGVQSSVNFITVDDGGSHAITTGFASNIVVGVPEPSSVMLLCSATIGLLGWIKTRRQA